MKRISFVIVLSLFGCACNSAIPVGFGTPYAEAQRDCVNGGVWTQDEFDSLLISIRSNRDTGTTKAEVLALAPEVCNSSQCTICWNSMVDYVYEVAP